MHAYEAVEAAKKRWKGKKTWWNIWYMSGTFVKMLCRICVQAIYKHYLCTSDKNGNKNPGRDDLRVRDLSVH